MATDENIRDEEFPTEDSLEEEIVEEPQDDSIDIDEALEEDGQQDGTQGTGEPEKQAAAQQPTQQEPGYVQRRISKAVEKALAEQREAFEAQMAPMREYMLNQEAQELVRTGKVKDLETAKELVRYRQGQPQPQPQSQEPQPRNERGQFVSRQQQGDDPVITARISMLQHQADRIKASGGPDVIAEFQNNEDIKEKIVSGEMDFYDVADQMRQKTASRKKSAPMRSANGANGAPGNAISDMSDEQFDRFVKKVQGGGRYYAK